MVSTIKPSGKRIAKIPFILRLTKKIFSIGIRPNKIRGIKL